jgi:hypothetical protein
MVPKPRVQSLFPVGVLADLTQGAQLRQGSPAEQSHPISSKEWRKWAI